MEKISVTINIIFVFKYKCTVEQENWLFFLPIASSLISKLITASDIYDIFAITVLKEIVLCQQWLSLKPRPNDRNMPTHHIAALLGATCWVRLATVLRCVATCWVLLA